MIDLNKLETLRKPVEKKPTPKPQQQKREVPQTSIPTKPQTDRQPPRQPDPSGMGRVSINKAIMQGQDPLRVLLLTLGVIRDLTGDDFFLQETTESVRVVYGALEKPGAIFLDIEETQVRIDRLKDALGRETNPNDQRRIRNAIQSHENRISDLSKRV